MSKGLVWLQRTMYPDFIFGIFFLLFFIFICFVKSKNKLSLFYVLENKSKLHWILKTPKHNKINRNISK